MYYHLRTMKQPLKNVQMGIRHHIIQSIK